MEEALRIAGQAAHNGRPDEIAAIFQDATAHLRGASTTQKLTHRRRHHSTDELRYGRNGFADSLAVPSKAFEPTSRNLQPMRRHARPRVDDPVELHHVGLPVVLRQGPEGVRAKVSNAPLLPPPTIPIVQPVPPRTSSRAPPSTRPVTLTTINGTSTATTLGPDSFDLQHPRKRHISLGANQNISLGRHHHRQPIAREWQTVRKRITATIACLNTVFIGLIVGIYVSGLLSSRAQYDPANIHRRVKSHEFSSRSEIRTTVSSWAMCCELPCNVLDNGVRQLTQTVCTSASPRQLSFSGRFHCSMDGNRTLSQPLP